MANPASSDVSAGNDALAEQYNNLRADLLGAHHSMTGGTLLVNADISASAAIAITKLATLTATRLLYSSAGGIITVMAAITANRALVTGANGLPVASDVTDTEIGYLDGVTSAIQTQLNAKQKKFGSYTSGLSASTVYTATYDSIVYGTVYAGPSGTKTAILYSDGDADPSTIVFQTGALDNQRISFCVPIKAGNKYKLVLANLTVEYYAVIPFDS